MWGNWGGEATGLVVQAVLLIAAVCFVLDLIVSYVHRVSSDESESVDD